MKVSEKSAAEASKEKKACKASRYNSTFTYLCIFFISVCAHYKVNTTFP